MGTDGGLREIAQELLSRYGLDEFIIHVREENFLIFRDQISQTFKLHYLAGQINAFGLCIFAKIWPIEWRNLTLF